LIVEGRGKVPGASGFQGGEAVTDRLRALQHSTGRKSDKSCGAVDAALETCLAQGPAIDSEEGSQFLFKDLARICAMRERADRTLKRGSNAVFSGDDLRVNVQQTPAGPRRRRNRRLWPETIPPDLLPLRVLLLNPRPRCCAAFVEPTCNFLRPNLVSLPNSACQRRAMRPSRAGPRRACGRNGRL